MQSETREEIRGLVRSGFYSNDELISIFCEEMYEPGELDPGEVERAVLEDLAAIKRDQESWPEETDVDRLFQAFAELNSLGIIALHNAGYTQSDGYSDVLDTYDQTEQKQDIIGYCFYHGQDLQRAVSGSGLMLAFGPIDSKLEETEGPRIGRMITATLERHGFRTEWNGSYDQRINITEIDWKNRNR